MMANLYNNEMTEKRSDFPVVGEHPGLDEEAAKTLRSARGKLPAETTETEGAEPIRDLTERLLEAALNSGDVEIQEPAAEDEQPPASMTPERLATTNRPPSPEDLQAILKAMKVPAVPTIRQPAGPDDKNKASGEEETIYCVEQEKD